MEIKLKISEKEETNPMLPHIFPHGIFGKVQKSHPGKKEERKRRENLLDRIEISSFFVPG